MIGTHQWACWDSPWDLIGKMNSRMNKCREGPSVFHSTSRLEVCRATRPAGGARNRRIRAPASKMRWQQTILARIAAGIWCLGIFVTRHGDPPKKNQIDSHFSKSQPYWRAKGSKPLQCKLWRSEDPALRAINIDEWRTIGKQQTKQALNKLLLHRCAVFIADTVLCM